MTVELAEEKGLKVDTEWFKEAEKKHQELSRAGAEQKVKWGLADDWEETTALHSATHLLLAGLNSVLWGWISQKGSNITPERLRFDFNFDRKVVREELDKVEEFVNKAINSQCEVELVNMDKQEAKDSWVEWSFWEKYPDTVKVYTFADKNWNTYSRELCWWPHVENTKTMGKFKIKKEESSSRGVRRIKAVLIKD
jgi:alanyl-tRNA synthetase